MLKRGEGGLNRVLSMEVSKVQVRLGNDLIGVDVPGWGGWGLGVGGGGILGRFTSALVERPVAFASRHAPKTEPYLCRLNTCYRT